MHGAYRIAVSQEGLSVIRYAPCTVAHYSSVGAGAYRIAVSQEGLSVTVFVRLYDVKSQIMRGPPRSAQRRDFKRPLPPAGEAAAILETL